MSDIHTVCRLSVMTVLTISYMSSVGSGSGVRIARPELELPVVRVSISLSPPVATLGKVPMVEVYSRGAWHTGTD
jgi:hypothetical protein